MRTGAGVGCAKYGCVKVGHGKGGRGSLGISDMPKGGIIGFHLVAVDPSEEDSLKDNFVPTNDSPYLKMNTFPQNTAKSKVQFFGVPFFNNFPLNALKHNLPQDYFMKFISIMD